MRIDEIDDAIEVCREHLNESGAWGSDVESFLTQYVLVRIRANFEQAVDALLRQPLAEVNDEYVIALAEHGIRLISRGSRTSHISETLGRIDATNALRNRFRSSISNTPIEQSFNRIAESRNAVAHGSGANFTFQELVDHYERAHMVLDALRDAIAGWRED